MAQRTQGEIVMARTHPNPETAAHLIFIRSADQAQYGRLMMADLYCAEAGSEQEANAEFIVKAWNSHDKLVETLRKIAVNARAAAEGDAEEWAMELHDIERDALAALAAAGAV